MILRSSTGVIVDDTNTSQTGESVLEMNHKELGLPSNCVDLKKFSCLNKDVVSFENVSANIENSNDVIIGPVTQFNVNGNVTFVRGGSAEDTDRDDQEKENSSRLPYEAVKSQKTEKSSSEDQNLKFYIQNKKMVKTVIAIIIPLIIIVGTIIFGITYELNTKAHVTKPNSTNTIDPQSPGDTENLGRHQLLSKTDWMGRKPKSYENISQPVSMVIIKHTGGGTCNDFQSCAPKAQTIQGVDFARGQPDIYCNFLVGGDANVYVGRGWDVRNEQRDSTIDIVYMGNFDIDSLSDSMVEVTLKLIEDGVKKSKLTSDYKIICHNQTANVRSPGVNVIKEVVNWKKYDRGLYFPKSLTTPSALKDP